MENTSTKQVITAPVASIIVTLTICLTVLFALGSFKASNLDYATVNFDGGYKKLESSVSNVAFQMLRSSLMTKCYGQAH
ncbi:hypothetical protein VPR01S_37_00020 [Vibrio proteolyticus NBRC 13287]|uniref:Uncharacterized protein n=1 Tax=Vibrio proteolyticus NBRC 13287 TaxID=1219065 RepID=U2ZP63_VIBPR|nr:hypothetical protein VPR01S_37_00020 [Vibrio proteolyticus NBRC 13287]